MSEQRAGRGEGLAGLVAELDSISDLLHEHAVGLRSTNVLRAREIGVLASRLDRAQVMLETAAAPAGTAPVTIRTLKDAVIYGREKGRPFSEEWFETVVRAINALATPSPQPRRTVLQQHQDKAISILRPYVCGSEFGECVALVAQAIADASPAATQEQPAGSGAKAKLAGVVCPFCGLGATYQAPTGLREFVCPNAHYWLPGSGSPRKVGENATMAIVHLAHEIQEQHRAVGPEPTTYPCQVACKCGAQIEAINRDALTVVFVNHVVMEALAARSSSVPVGEQTQEDGATKR